MHWLRIKAQEGVPFPRPIPSDYVGVVGKLQAIANKHGYTVYAVGGFVRDALLGREPKDLDVMVPGPGAGVKFAEIVAEETGTKVSDVYGRIGTATVTVDGKPVEFAMARKESYPDELSRTPEVEPGTIREDALRRDFGTNSLFLRLNDMQLLDLTGHGLKDLEAKVIKIADPGDPDRVFHEDPLRMLRAIRQALQLGFAIDEEVLGAIKRNAPRLSTISAERTRDELAKMIVTQFPSKGVRLLIDLGLIEHVAPEVQALVGVEQPSRYHGEDVFEHTMMVLDELKDENVTTRLAALLHDVGKPTTKVITEGIASFLGHEDVGADMAKAILRRLRFPNDVIEQVATLVKGHMRHHLYKQEWSDKAIRRTIRELGDLLEQSLTLAEADVRGTMADPEDKERRLKDLAELRERIQQVQEVKPVSEIPELLSGDEMMAMFGQGPGRWIRQMKDFLRDKQDENPHLTKEEGIELVKKYFEEHQEELKLASWIDLQLPSRPPISWVKVA